MQGERRKVVQPTDRRPYDFSGRRSSSANREIVSRISTAIRGEATSHLDAWTLLRDSNLRLLNERSCSIPWKRTFDPVRYFVETRTSLSEIASRCAHLCEPWDLRATITANWILLPVRLLPWMVERSIRRNISAVVSNSNRSCDDWTWDDILSEVDGQSVERDWNF